MCFICMLVWTPHVCLLSLEARRGLRILRNWSTDGCERPCGCYDPNLDFWKGQCSWPLIHLLIFHLSTPLYFLLARTCGRGFETMYICWFSISFCLILSIDSIPSSHFISCKSFYLIVDFEFFSLFCCIMNILMLDQLSDNIRCYGSDLTCLIPLS